MSSFQQLTQDVARFNEERDWDQFHSPGNLAKSIVIEAAELLELVQWHDDAIDVAAAREELADVIIYCAQLAARLDIDLDSAITDKLRMNEMKYPVEKAYGSSAKYTELDA